MKVIIIGGHFTPALAVIEALHKDAEVIYVGRKYIFEKDKTVSLEYQKITKMSIQFVSLKTGRFQRHFTRQTIPSLLRIPYGFIQSIRLLQKHKPDVIVGFGGYLSVPICFAGKLLGIPIVIHEQTLEAGLANKLISQFADKVCISWDSSKRFFPKEKTILTGNPLPAFKPPPFGKAEACAGQAGELLTSVPSKRGMVPLLCVIGGSSGSHAINVLIEGCLRELLEKFTVIHQTGNAQEFGDYERLQKLKQMLPQRLQKRYTILTYIEPEHFMPTLEAADLVVSRCGINTITTLFVLQKKSILIPLPFSQRNEQYKNALMLKQGGLAEIAKQEEMTAKKLFDKIVFFYNNKVIHENPTAQTPIQSGQKQKAQTTAATENAAKNIVVVIIQAIAQREKN